MVIRPADLDADSRGRLRRTRDHDLDAVREILRPDSDEDRVLGAFRAHLAADGWSITDPTDRWSDIEAVRGAERLIGEAKGRTTSPGVGFSGTADPYIRSFQEGFNDQEGSVDGS